MYRLTARAIAILLFAASIAAASAFGLGEGDRFGKLGAKGRSGTVTPPAWTPKTPAGLIAWYKADNDNTNIFSDTGCTTPQTTNTGTIGCWKDKSGNGYHAITAGANLPTYSLTGLHSKPTVTFVNGAQNQYLYTAAGVAMGSGSVISGFAEMQWASIGNYDVVVSYAPPSGSPGSTGGTYFILANATTTAFLGGKGNVLSGATTAAGLATPFRGGYVNDGTQGTSYLNNVAGTSTANANASITAGRIAIGSSISNNLTTGTRFNGNASEIIIYNQALSSADKTSLDAYLAARW